MNTRYSMLLCALSLIASSSASEIDFSYNVNNLPTHGYGFGKAETYDVAIRIDEPSLKGAAIKGITVELPGGENISGASGWLTNELTLKRDNGKYVNVADIMTSEGTLADGVLTVVFAEPYQIDGPLYAGYTFVVDENTSETAEPIMIADGINPDGLYIHSSRSKLKWNSLSETAGGVSAMKVTVEGDFKDNSAAFINPGGLECSVEDESVTFTLSVANHGPNAIEKIDYTYSFGGESGEANVTFTEPIAGNWGAIAQIDVTLPQPKEEGTTDLRLTVTSVNGSGNNDLSPETVIPVKVYPFIPVNRPLVEEYTGLWCGWCPRGYVALETMHERYPEQFIGVAYHSGDAMSSDCEWPNSPSGFPDGYINRGKANLGDIYSIWPKAAASLPPAEINVAVEWTDEDHTKLKATSATRFLESYEKADFGVSYILVADGLTNPEWAQSNYYSGLNAEEYPEMTGKWGEMFLNGPNPLTGLTFNDVAVANKEMNGFPGSIPTQIKANESISHSCVFNLDEIKQQDLVAWKGDLRVIAILIDRKSGKPVNCNTSAHATGESGIEGVATATQPESTEWYSLQGVRIDRPAEGMGILIKIERKANGTIKSTKQVF